MTWTTGGCVLCRAKKMVPPMALAAVGTKVYVLSTQEEVDKFMQKHITAYGLPE